MKYLKTFENLNANLLLRPNDLICKVPETRRIKDFLETLFGDERMINNKTKLRRQQYVKSVLLGLSLNEINMVIDDMTDQQYDKFVDFLAHDLGIEKDKFVTNWQGETLIKEKIKEWFELTPMAISQYNSSTRFDL